MNECTSNEVWRKPDCRRVANDCAVYRFQICFIKKLSVTDTSNTVLDDVVFTSVSYLVVSYVVCCACVLALVRGTPAATWSKTCVYARELWVAEYHFLALDAGWLSPIVEARSKGEGIFCLAWIVVLARRWVSSLCLWKRKEGATIPKTIPVLRTT